MKTIALVGAPGAGKSDLAQAIYDKVSGPQCGNCPPKAVIVDDYAFETRDFGEYEIGLNGGYMANIDIATMRYRQERLAGHQDFLEYMIVCGTIVETAVYCAQYFQRTLEMRNTEEDKMQEAQRFQAVTAMCATLYMDTFKYERAFYLPSAQKPEDERWEAFERNLQAAFQVYATPVVPLVIEDFADREDLTQKRLERIFS